MLNASFELEFMAVFPLMLYTFLGFRWKFWFEMTVLEATTGRNIGRQPFFSQIHSFCNLIKQFTQVTLSGITLTSFATTLN